MKRPMSLLLFIVFCFFITDLYTHGFYGETIVHLDERTALTIKEVCKEALYRKKTVISLDPVYPRVERTLIESVGKSKVPWFISINFDNEKQQDIICSPLQEFYCVDLNQWTPAYKLRIGDAVWSRYNQRKTITTLKIIEHPFKVYHLRIQGTHTFFVGRHWIITHNMFLPLVTVGLGASFGSGAATGGTVGSFFGPIGLTCGLALGGCIGVAVCLSLCKIPRYTVDCYLGKECLVHLAAKSQPEKDEEKPSQPTPEEPTSQNGDKPKVEEPEEETKPEVPSKSSGPLTNQEARKKAQQWGYQEDKQPPFFCYGKPAFKHPKRREWITPDKYGHNGGVWKLFEGRKRVATLDKFLQIIKG